MDELKDWKIGLKIAKYIFNFLTNRKISVLANKVYSTSQSLDNGIPQGSPLSVILFVIAYNKLNQIIAKQKNCQFTAYADDYTIIYKLNKKTTNLNIDPLFREILVWCDYSGAKLSDTKCKHLHVCRKRKCNFAFHPSNITLQDVDTIKILGITINKK